MSGSFGGVFAPVGMDPAAVAEAASSLAPESAKADRGMAPPSTPPGGLSRRDLESMAARAATLSERVTALPADSHPDQPTAADLDPWVRAFSPGDRAAFLCRLSWDGWSEPVFARAIAVPPPCSSPSAREWLGTMERAASWCPSVAAELDAEGRVVEESYFATGRPAPFLELCCPFLRAARETLETGLEGRGRISSAAWIDLERQLLSDLSAQSALAFQERFARFRSAAGYPAGPCVPPTGNDPRRAGTPSRELYQAYVRRVLRREMPGFLLEYSLLARQLCRLVETWVSSTRELVTRLDTDWLELENELGRDAPLGSVAGIATGLSDRHRGGRQVLALRFASGARVVYKPRCVALEAAFYRLLAWLGERGLVPAPRLLRVLARQDYGWVEFLEPAPARDRSEVAAYHRRAGALLCLGYVLRGDDLCADNVIATPGGPVIVDCENLLQPRLGAASSEAGRRDVLRSQLLSSIQIDPTGAPYDAGGLNGGGGQVAEVRRRVWCFSNSDAMFCSREVARAEPAANLLRYGGSVQRPSAWAAEILRGFADTYRLLLRHRRALLEEDGPLAGFAGHPARVLFRPSNAYAAMLHLLTRPRYQRDAIPGAILGEALARELSTETERPAVWPLIRQERRELDGLDLPYLTLETSRRVFDAGGEPAPGLVAASGLEAVRCQTETLSEEGLEEQAGLLAGVLSELRGPALAGAWTAARKLGPVEEQREAFLRQAVRIGERLRRRAESAREGDAAMGQWLQPDFARGLPLSLNLYDGAAGIGLFLAALADATGEEAYAALACSAGAVVTDALETSPGRVPGVGGSTGLGGVVYSQVVMARLLRRADLLEHAARTAARIDPERIAAASADVADGLAGAVLGLLVLYDHRPAPELLERARLCCRRLVAMRRASTRGTTDGWPVEGRFFGGFAHGAAGIGCSLARFYQASGEAFFLGEALSALAIADRLLAAAARDAGLALSWCHGVVGLGLAHLDAWDALAGHHARREVDELARVSAAPGLSLPDHLCCGNLGRIDFLVEDSTVTGRATYLERAARLAERVLECAEARGGYRLDDDIDGSYDPGFFRGLSGIGYTLLRLARPGAFPSVLALRRVV